MSLFRTGFVALSVVMLGGCQHPEGMQTSNVSQGAARAALVGNDGSAKGEVEVGRGTGGLVIRIDASGIPEGPHGLHLHEKGYCEGPDFKSAGGHWNPFGKRHGRDNPAGAHLGDLPNLQVGADGKSEAILTVAGSSIDGAQGIADADGTALVIHAKADDNVTDPSGASGERIACAVLAPPKAN